MAKTKGPVQSWRWNSAHTCLLRAPEAQLLRNFSPRSGSGAPSSPSTPRESPPPSSNYRPRWLGKGQLVRETRPLRCACADHSSRSAAADASIPQAPAAAFHAWPTALAAWEPRGTSHPASCQLPVIDPAAWRGATSPGGREGAWS